MTLYIPGIINGQQAMASITHQLHVVDNLQAKLLIRMDILGPEQAIVNIGRRRLILPMCENLQAELAVSPRAARTTGRIVLAQSLTTIPPKLVMSVPVRLRKTVPLPPQQDFLFQLVSRGLNLGAQGGPRAHIVDSNFTFVEV